MASKNRVEYRDKMRNERIAKRLNDARARHEQARTQLLAVVAECETSFAAECEAAEALERARDRATVPSAPRLTRDEAIALCKDALYEGVEAKDFHPKLAAGIRLALEALAAAGVFSDSDPCPWCEANREVTPDPGSSCETCDGSGRLRTMADKLDAADIR